MSRLICNCRIISQDTICRSVLTLLLMILAGVGCTESPFGSSSVSGGSRSVSGIVNLGDGANPEGAVVFLDGFNLISRTDSDGSFLLTLPPPGAQGVSGMNGIFGLWFYVNNYAVDSASVVIRDGNFCYNAGDINKHGRLYAEKTLGKLVHIKTSIDPLVIDTSFSGDIRVTTTLTTAGPKQVTVWFPRLSEAGIAWIFLRHVETGEAFLVGTSLVGLHASSKKTIGNTPLSLTFPFAIRGSRYPVGAYEIIPYLYVLHEHSPPGILNVIGVDTNDVGLEYLNIPFKRECARLRIRFPN